MKNYYKTLGISQNASLEEIKKAYIQLAIKYHPDKNPGDTLSEQFKEINEAKQVLLNDLKKFSYDTSLVDFLANNSNLKSKVVRRKRTKRMYDKAKKTLRKNRLSIALLFSVTILISAAIFQLYPDESAIDSPRIQLSDKQLEKKPLEAKAVVLSSFETNKKEAEQTPLAKEVANVKSTVSAKKVPEKKKMAATSSVKTTAPQKQKVLPL